MCIRVQLPNRPGFAFVEGAVTQIHNETKTYSVLLLNGSGNSDEIRSVKRGQIRLLRPPWWDELNDVADPVSATGIPRSTGGCVDGRTAFSVVNTTAPSNNKRPFYSNSGTGQPTAIIYSNNATVPSANRNHSVVETNNRLKYSTRVDTAGTPLQLHHVLPTIQV